MLMPGTAEQADQCDHVITPLLQQKCLGAQESGGHTWPSQQSRLIDYDRPCKGISRIS